MRNKIFSALFFACFGVTTEIVFTGLTDNIILPLWRHDNINYSLPGQSYVWMIFIYGAIPFLFPVIYQRISHLHLILRLMIYASILLLVEYISGWVLDMITGDCPWRYSTGWQISGYIRIDYFPLWMLFGFIVERLWKSLGSLSNYRSGSG